MFVVSEVYPRFLVFTPDGCWEFSVGVGSRIQQMVGVVYQR